MIYRDALAWLYGTQLHGIKLGLDNMRRLAGALGLRLTSTGQIRFVHVAGTNGKGSTCAMIASICEAAGLKTALFTSPHLVSFRERIQINRALIPEEAAARGLSLLQEQIRDWRYSPTFFELTTALALSWFQECGAEIVVLETGMGGRLDATNIVHPSVSVLTPIAIDHAQWLGDTIAEIAMEKAGIIKHGIPVVSAPQDELARTVIAHIAFEREATCQFLEAPIDSPDAGRVGLAGSHQRWNAALAVAALEAGGIVIDRAAQARGLQTVRWPGRFQQIDDGLVLDGAHNPAAAHALVATWREKFGSRKATIIFGVLADKDVDGVWRALAPIAGHVYAVAPKSARALAADVVAPRLQAETPAIPCEVALDLGEALASAARNDLPILVTGSLFLVGEALAHLRGENEFEPSAQ